MTRRISKLLSLREISQSETRQKGLIGLYLTIVVLVLMIGILASIGFGVLIQQRIIQNMTQSAQAYFAAESGAEDALIRLERGMNWVSPYSVSVGNGSAQVTISPILAGGVRTITVEGNALNRVRKVRITYAIDSAKPGFAFGAQVGDFGLTVGNSGSGVDGNVYSNGNITGSSYGQSSITGTAKAAGSSAIKDIRVDRDAYAGSFQDCSIGGTAHYVTSFTCPIGASVLGTPVPVEPLPISDDQINSWKNDAQAGGTLASFAVGNNSSATLGPKKITGNLTMDNNSTLTLFGTVWVAGTISFGNNATVRLHSSYETLSGVFITDGAVTTKNDTILQGSGQSGSYLLLLSTYGDGALLADAIVLKNNATGAILYAPNDFINVNNNLSLRQATGRGIKLGNSAVLIYEAGLADAAFVSGPTGGWKVTSWKEIE